jgi:GWxTD domain-containing protein
MPRIPPVLFGLCLAVLLPAGSGFCGPASSSEDKELRFQLRCLQLFAEEAEAREIRRLRRESPEAQKAYIEAFWEKRRGAFVNVPMEAVRALLEKRCREAENLFGGSDNGMLSERGRLWVFWGPPDERYTSIRLPGNMTIMGRHPIEAAERWVYYSPPDRRLPPYYAIEFIRLVGSHAFEPSVRVNMSLGLLTSSTPLNLGAFVDYGLTPQDLTLPAATARPPAAAQNLPPLMNLLARTDSASDFPVNWHVYAVRAANPEFTALVLTLRLRPSDLGEVGPAAGEAPLTGVRITSQPEEIPDDAAFVPSQDAEGLPARPLDIFLELRPFARNAEISPYHYYQATVVLRPASYRLRFGAMLASSQKAAVDTLALDVPSFSSSDPRLTGPLLVRGKIQELGEAELAALGPDALSRPLVLGDRHFAVPRIENDYRPSETLSIYCQVYNPKRPGDTRNAPYHISLARNFRPLDGDAYQRIDVLERWSGLTGDVWGLEIPLQDYLPGFYYFEITVKDARDPQKTYSRGVYFSVSAP